MKPRQWFRPATLLPLLFFMLIGAAHCLGAEEEGPKTPPRSITMNFQDVDIGVFIKFISELTGKNFLVDPGVKGTLTIYSPSKVSVSEAYQVFLSVLDVHGYTVVPAGNIIKILPSAEARAKGMETRVDGRGRAREDKVVTQLLRLEHGDANEFSRTLKPLVAKTGLLIAYPETNSLILIDTDSNVKRLIRILDELDVPSSKEMLRIFNLEHASAKELAPKLTDLLQKTRGKKLMTSEQIKIIAYERTNSLIVLAPAQNMLDIESLLKELDRKITQPRGRIHTYALQNAVAEDVAKVLGEIPGKGAAEGKEGLKAPVLSKDVQISADKATNTLVVVAEREEFEILEEIIRKLDVPRTMVYVEALIMEVTTSKALQLGVQWRIGNEYSEGYGEDSTGGVWMGGAGGTGGEGSATGDFQAGLLPSGLALGVVGRAITLGDVSFPSISAFIRAVRTDSDFNIISTPQILTLDNEEAVIEVGQNIPFLTSVDQGTETTSRAIQNYEYKDVGVTLKVTPQINDNGIVRLNVEQSIKSVIQAGSAGLLTPSTTFRTTKSAIAVRDGETAVIGGLIQEQFDRARTQAPCLGGIPLFGWLFKDISDNDEKNNLMVFLTPHTVDSAEERNLLYQEKKERMDQEVEQYIDKSQTELLRRKAFE